MFRPESDVDRCVDFSFLSFFFLLLSFLIIIHKFSVALFPADRAQCAFFFFFVCLVGVFCCCCFLFSFFLGLINEAVSNPGLGWRGGWCDGAGQG